MNSATAVGCEMDDTMSLLLIAIPSLPLVAAIVIAILGPRVLGGRSHYPLVAALATAFVCSILLLNQVRLGNHGEGVPGEPDHAGFSRTVTLWTWAAIPDAYLQPGADDPQQVTSRDFRLDITLRADALTCVMLSMVTFVSTLVAFFASGYMHGDRGYWRFFAYFGLFVFSMTMLVSCSNFVLLFVFWEAVGLCSYLLIGFWYEKSSAAAAGKKAFLVNRVGDFGFTLALFLIWMNYGTLNFHDSLSDGVTDRQAIAAVMEAELSEGEAQVVHGVLGRWRIADRAYVGGTVGFAICAFLLLGACGKSAQLPLHVWLPDAMEGPTPVSALIHAATMVTAGIYMIARCTPLFMASPAAQLLVACVGTATALLAALIALTQNDLKRVLAYSTVSQLGYMFIALGVGTFGGITAGMFHLFTHAFFKALLFLGAGSVMHAMGNVIDMRRFGGLRRRMPITHITFFIGCLALAGFPGLAGFWSKDAIVAAVHEKGHEIRHPSAHGADDHSPHAGSLQSGGPWQLAAFVAEDAGTIPAEQRERYAAIYDALYVVALITALLTAFYTFRALYLTFYGPEVIPHEAGDHAHESPPIMYWPLRILAIGAASLGFLLDQTWRREPNHLFADFLGSAPSLADGAVAATRHPFVFHGDVAAASSLIALGGIFLATYLYLGDQREVRWLRSVLDLQAFAESANLPPLERLRQMNWVSNCNRYADRCGVAWLTNGIGNLLSLVLLVVSTPLLLGNFISPYKLSLRKFFIDELYEFTVVLPLRGIAWLCYAVDRWFVDGLVNTVGRLAPTLGSLIRLSQTGLVPFYALAMVLGTLVLVAVRVIWAG